MPEKPEEAGERTNPDLPHVEVHGLRRHQASASSPAQGGFPRLQLLPNLRPHLPDELKLPKHNRRIAQ
jgi:hypothetical protein